MAMAADSSYRLLFLEHSLRMRLDVSCLKVFVLNCPADLVIGSLIGWEVRLRVLVFEHFNILIQPSGVSCLVNCVLLWLLSFASGVFFVCVLVAWSRLDVGLLSYLCILSLIIAIFLVLCFLHALAILILRVISSNSIYFQPVFIIFLSLMQFKFFVFFILRICIPRISRFQLSLIIIILL